MLIAGSTPTITTESQVQQNTPEHFKRGRGAAVAVLSASQQAAPPQNKNQKKRT